MISTFRYVADKDPSLSPTETINRSSNAHAASGARILPAPRADRQDVLCLAEPGVGESTSTFCLSFSFSFSNLYLLTPSSGRRGHDHNDEPTSKPERDPGGCAGPDAGRRGAHAGRDDRHGRRLPVLLRLRVMAIGSRRVSIYLHRYDMVRASAHK